MDNETMADQESPLLIDDIRDADPNKYHPHDVLIYKYYTATEVANSPHPRALLCVSRMQEEEGLGAPRIPWPLPPPSRRDTLEIGVEEWRASALRTID